jgi:hypothetical protein
MADMALRDRFFTPRVARAITSPTGILAAGGGVAVGVVAGLPVAGAVGLGALAWAGRVAVAVGWGGSRRERVDPFTLQEPWRRFVQDALSARGRFREAVDRTRSGPLQDTLRDIARRIDTGVEECWLVAQRGDSLVQSRNRIDTASIDRELAEAEAAVAASAQAQAEVEAAVEGPAGGPADGRLQQVLESLRAQRATADRMDRVIDEARSQLRLLDARLDEAVVRAVELSAQATTGAAASSLSSDVDSMVTDMEALRLALEETHGTAGGLNQSSGPG